MTKWSRGLLLAMVVAGGCQGAAEPAADGPGPRSAAAARDAGAGADDVGVDEVGAQGGAAPRHPSPVIADLVERFRPTTKPDGSNAESELEAVGQHFSDFLLIADGDAIAGLLLTPDHIDDHYRPAFATMLKMEGRSGFDRAWQQFITATAGQDMRVLEVELGEVSRPGPSDGVNSMFVQEAEFADNIRVRCSVGDRHGAATLRNLLLTADGWRALKFEFEFQ